MTYTPKNILVTGGCGFIGSNFLNKLVLKYPSYKFVNFDALYYCASLNNITIADKDNYKFVQGNLSSLDIINFTLREYNIDTVIHFAAQSHVDNSFSNPLQYTYDNIVGTHNLLEACNKYGKITRFVHVSTDEVYGESDFDDNTKKTEQSILRPTNPYAATKAGAESIGWSYFCSYKFPIIITRGNNVYGERQYPEKLIPRFIYLLKEDKMCTIHGNGSNLRSYVFIDDVVNAFDIILHYGKLGQIYNIGSCHEYSVSEITKKLIEKIKDTKDYDKWIKYVPDRNFNDKRYYIDDQKLGDLGWTKNVSFDEGLDRIIKWYLDIDYKKYWNMSKLE